MTDELIRVDHVARYFPMGRHKILKAVDDVSFAIRRGETFGLVGESGCGKSTLGRTMIGLYDCTRGSVSLAGRDLQSFTSKQDRATLSRRMQMIF